jgi:tRNA modification GTPase
MFSSDDTIAAIATPEGRGGIGIVRLSGPDAVGIATRILARREKLEPRHATLTKVRLDRSASGVGDQVIATWFPAPQSYTGEHVVEISAHGSPVVLRAILDSLVGEGARLARPGEFTFRAYLNSRLDLIQAEAVADLVDAVTPLQARVAFAQLEGTLSDQVRRLDAELLDLIARLEASLDFPDEGFHFIEPHEVGGRIGAVLACLEVVLQHSERGRVVREGAKVAIVGRANVGKSSLFNALLGEPRAIVTEVPGTTRDLVTEQVEIDGLAVTLIDTAGIRVTGDLVEQEGVNRAMGAIGAADLLLVVIDSGDDLDDEDRRLLEDVVPLARRLVIASKSDRRSRWDLEGAIRVSTLTHAGIDTVKQAIVSALSGGDALRDTPAISNLRHASLLRRAQHSLRRAQAAADEHGAPEEFVLVDLHQARAHFEEVVGASTNEDVLRHIFDRFCVGK